MTGLARPAQNIPLVRLAAPAHLLFAWLTSYA
jgi:hypothetical protein